MLPQFKKAQISSFAHSYNLRQVRMSATILLRTCDQRLCFRSEGLHGIVELSKANGTIL